MERRGITYKEILFGLAIPLLLGVGGFLLRDLYADVKTIRENKLDKSEFYQVFKQMDSKSDLIIELLRDHEQNTKRIKKKVRYKIEEDGEDDGR
jgi:hypothetical protein